MEFLLTGFPSNWAGLGYCASRTARHCAVENARTSPAHTSAEGNDRTAEKSTALRECSAVKSTAVREAGGETLSVSSRMHAIF